MDKIVRAVTSDGYVKLAAITSRQLAERARQIHNASPVATAALGRVLSATSIIGNTLKEEGASVTVRINGGGPLGSIIAVSDSAGNVRGYLQHPEVDLPKRHDGKLDVGSAVGRNGMLTVSRDLGLKEPYVGSTALVSGEIAEDFTAYFAESEQVGAACGLGVLVGADRSVKAAGGFILMLLPGAPGGLIDTLESNIASMGQVTDILSAGGGADTLAKLVLNGLGPRILETAPVEYRCKCTRERVLDALLSLGGSELGQIARGQEDTTVSCQFCDEVYRFTPDEVRRLLEQSLNEQAGAQAAAPDEKHS